MSTISKLQTTIFSLILSTISTASLANCAPKTIPVHLTVLVEQGGRGNEHWRLKDRQAQFMKYLNESSFPEIDGDLKLVKIQFVQSKYFWGRQKEILKKYDHLRLKGVITAVISSEVRVDTGGTANGVKRKMDPYFVFRTRIENSSPNPSHVNYVNGKSMIAADARLFAHELGHQMDLAHTDAINPDNYATNGRGKHIYVKYFKDLYNVGAAYRMSQGITDKCTQPVVAKPAPAPVSPVRPAPQVKPVYTAPAPVRNVYIPRGHEQYQ